MNKKSVIAFGVLLFLLYMAPVALSRLEPTPEIQSPIPSNTPKLFSFQDMSEESETVNDNFTLPPPDSFDDNGFHAAVPEDLPTDNINAFIMTDDIFVDITDKGALKYIPQN